MEPKSPALQVDSLTAEPQEKPKNTGVDSLSLLQRIFLTQELNWGLLHCRRILYQLSYQGFSLFSVLESEKKILKSIKREASKIHNFYKSLIDPWVEWRPSPSTQDERTKLTVGHFIYGSSLTKFNGGGEHSTCLHDITFIASRTQFKSPPRLGNQENMPNIQDKWSHSKWGLLLHKYKILSSNLTCI